MNNLGYVEAVEKLGEWEVPERALFVRTAIAELTRIASHLLWLGTHALDLGHYFGMPSLVAKKLFGRWILAPNRWNLAKVEERFPELRFSATREHT